MMMIQDGPYLNAPEKPLRIMGDAMRTQRGKDLVQDLLTEKELEVSGQGTNRNWQVMTGRRGFTGIHSQTNMFVNYERWLSLTGGVFETKHFVLVGLCD